MNTLVLILGFACMAHLIVDFLQDLDWAPLNRKPFSCDMCTAFWISVPFLCGLHGWTGIPLAAITAVLADVIFRWKEKL